MKNTYLRSLIVAALSSAVLGCSKDEGTILDKATKLSSATIASSSLVYKNVTSFPEQGKQPDGWVGQLYDYGEDGDYTVYYPFKEISNVTCDYLKETCLFDISHLEDGKAYRQVNNKSLKIAFFSYSQHEIYLTKLRSAGPPDLAWTADWGTFPSVEKKKPDVLFVHQDDEFAILLSKPVIEFGFEMAPNSQNEDFGYGLFFGNTKFDDTRGSAGATISTPSGAKLFAVKSTKPFNTITVFYSKKTGSDHGSEGVAIGNIRYKLAK